MRGLKSDTAASYLPIMIFEIEFFRREKAAPGQGTLVRRNRGQFAGEKDAEIFALTNGPPEADGFRILYNGALRKTVSIRSENPTETG